MARVDRAHFHYPPGSYQGEDPAGGASEWQLLSKEVPFVDLLTFGPSSRPVLEQSPCSETLRTFVTSSDSQLRNLFFPWLYEEKPPPLKLLLQLC